MGKNLIQIVRDLRLKVLCKNRDAGCTHKGIEDEMEEHEDECGHRKVKCDFVGCKYIPFNDLLNHLKDAHEIDCDAKKWTIYNEVYIKNESVGHCCAYKYEIGPKGLVFATYICRYEDFFDIVVRVLGGKQVAKEYRVELRVSSNESLASVTHSGPVFPIDYYPFEVTRKRDSFEMRRSRFAFFNQGTDYFGKHNKDKNGDIALPISVKIEKKKLGCPTN